MTEKREDRALDVTGQISRQPSGRGFVSMPDNVLSDNLLRAESSPAAAESAAPEGKSPAGGRRKGWKSVLFSQKGIGWLVLLALNIFIVVMHLTLPAFDLTAHGWLSVDYLIGDFHHASAWHLIVNLISLDLIFLTFPVKCYGTSIVIRFMILNYLTNIGIGMLCTDSFRYAAVLDVMNHPERLLQLDFPPLDLGRAAARCGARKDPAGEPHRPQPVRDVQQPHYSEDHEGGPPYRHHHDRSCCNP